MLSVNKLLGLARLEFTSINKSLLGEVGITESGGRGEGKGVGVFWRKGGRGEREEKGGEGFEREFLLLVESSWARGPQ